MNLKKQHMQTLAFLALYIFAVSYWSQPYRQSKLPYGEFDAMSHFEVADYMAYNDKSFVKLPDYIDIRYGTDNNFRPHTLWYPPTFHASLAVAESVSNERVVPVYLMNTILATFIIVTLYFVINALFGFLPAILASLLLIFSPRDFMPFLWGQWPERFSYAFIPVILYCLYNYILSYKSEKKEPKYLYLSSLFLGTQLLVHPLGFFHSVIAIAVLYLIFAIKERKLFFNAKHVILALLIFLVLFFSFPGQTFNILPSLGIKVGKDTQVKEIHDKEPPDYSRIFKWSMDPADFAGSVPATYFSYNLMHGAWTIYFLILGLIVIFLRRKDQDWFILAWLISMYLVLHRDLIGISFFLHRSLSATMHIFAPIMAIGAIYATSLIKIPWSYWKHAKYILFAVFIYLALSVNMKEASKSLNERTYTDLTTYNFLLTLSPQQIHASEWILHNVPMRYNVSVLGIPHQEQLISATAKKIRWGAAMSQHVHRFYYLLDDKEAYYKINYVMIDYTMAGPLGMQDFFQEMQLFEQNLTSTHSLVYNQNNIRIYRPLAA
jgi:hypothetical protein